jgi:excisionase family DNA binding protein
MPDDEYVTVAQAAQQSGLSAGHLERLLRQGRLAGIKPGHDWLVRPSAVAAYLKERRPPGRPRKGGRQVSESD